MDYTEKGRKWLAEYIAGQSEMSPETQRRLFKVIYDEYRERMKDEKFAQKVNEFVGKRRTKAEKEKFFYGLMVEIVPGVRKRI